MIKKKRFSNIPKNVVQNRYSSLTRVSQGLRDFPDGSERSRIDCPPTMVLMLALIVCRIIPLSWVRAGARWLLAEMLLFFVPAVVAVVNYAHLLLVDGWRIFSVIAISTLMVLGATAWVVDKVYRYEMSRLNRE